MFNDIFMDHQKIFKLLENCYTTNLQGKQYTYKLIFYMFTILFKIWESIVNIVKEIGCQGSFSHKVFYSKDKEVQNREISVGNQNMMGSMCVLCWKIVILDV
jgi:hypothetical protein